MTRDRKSIGGEQLRDATPGASSDRPTTCIVESQRPDAAGRPLHRGIHTPFPPAVGVVLSFISALAALMALAAAPAFASGTETLKVSISGSGTGTVSGAGIECGNGAETCEAQFAAKSVITLTATPTERSTFARWSGCTEVPSPTKCRVRIAAGVPTEIGAEFSAIPQETLAVVNPGAGLGGGRVVGTTPGREFSEIECGNEREGCQAEYNQAAVITLTATPTERSTFSGWEAGDCKSESGPGNDECKVEMTKAETVKAEFVPIPQKTLSVAAQGAGQGTLTASPGGEFASIECGNGATACEAQYNQGTTLVLTARSSTHSKFVAWTGCEAQPSETECEVTLSATRAITAEFLPIPQQPLELSVTGPGEVTSSPPGIACTSTGETCSEHFDSEGSEGRVTLFASPPADHHVVWSGCEISSGTECTVTMSSARSVTAQFLPTLQTVLVTRIGAGEITSSPSGIACDEDLCSADFQEGATVVLTAHPAAHNRLGAWGVGECKEEPSPTECEIEIGASFSIVAAEFAPISHTFAVAVSGGGSVSASAGPIAGCAHGGGVCAGEYDEGSTLVLTASPFSNSTLPTWSGCTPKPNPAECEVTIGSSGETIHADFPPNSHTLTVEPFGSGSISADSGTISDCSEAGGTCAGSYIEAATLTLIATPGPHQAVAWHGCTHTEEDSCQVEIGASSSSVKASFAQITHALTVTRVGSGQGSVTCNGATCASSYPEGTTLTLTASPAAGSAFAGWSGGGCSGTGACHLTFEADTTVTATFNANTAPPIEEEKKPPPLKCRNGFVKKNGRCVRKSKPRHHKKKH